MAEVMDMTVGGRMAVAYRKAENCVRRRVYPRVVAWRWRWGKVRAFGGCCCGYGSVMWRMWMLWVVAYAHEAGMSNQAWALWVAMQRLVSIIS